jgi:hypothetical protein
MPTYMWLLVGWVAAIVIKYRVLGMSISKKRDTTGVYYNARGYYWCLLQYKGEIPKLLMGGT